MHRFSLDEYRRSNILFSILKLVQKKKIKERAKLEKNKLKKENKYGNKWREETLLETDCLNRL